MGFQWHGWFMVDEKFLMKIRELDDEFLENVEKANGMKLDPVLRVEIAYALTRYTMDLIKLMKKALTS